MDCLYRGEIAGLETEQFIIKRVCTVKSDEQLLATRLIGVLFCQLLRDLDRTRLHPVLAGAMVNPTNLGDDEIVGVEFVKSDDPKINLLLIDNDGLPDLGLLEVELGREREKRPLKHPLLQPWILDPRLHDFTCHPWQILRNDCDELGSLTVITRFRTQTVSTETRHGAFSFLKVFAILCLTYRNGSHSQKCKKYSTFLAMTAN